MRKIITGILITILCLVAFMSSGCIEYAEDNSSSIPTPKIIYVPQPTPTPEIIYIPQPTPYIKRVPTYTMPQTTTQTITIGGIDKITSVSGECIIIGGLNNEVTILNSDIKRIIIGGIDNTVYYPRNSRPEIIHGGIDCKVLTY